MPLAPRSAAWSKRRRNTPGPFGGTSGTGVAPDPTDIPYAWLSPPLTRRPTTAYTKAQVTQSGGDTAYASASAATVRQYGANSATTSLATAVDADTRNLANHIVTYQSTPRPRQPTLRIILTGEPRTDADRLRVLNVQLGQRVRITDAPATWPAGAVTFVVEGIRHYIAADQRWVEWMTSAPIGEVAGVPGPWFRWGSSYWNGPDSRPF